MNKIIKFFKVSSGKILVVSLLYFFSQALGLLYLAGSVKLVHNVIFFKLHKIATFAIEPLL
ncbi:hypothetical protein ACFLY5_00770, partial [Patescibacteria group bacterium]